MGCNCNGKAGTTYVYIYTAPNGSTTQYRTEIEAQAARIRQGGGSYKTVAR